MNLAFEVGAGVLFLLWWFGIVPTPQWGHDLFRIVAAPFGSSFSGRWRRS